MLKRHICTTNPGTSTCHTTHRNVNVIFRGPRSRLIAAILRSSITFNPRGLKLRHRLVNRHVISSLRTIKLTGLHRSSPAHVDNKRRRHTTVTNVLTVGPTVLMLSRPATVLSRSTHTRIVHVLSSLRTHNAAVIRIARRPSRAIRTSHVIRVRTKQVVNVATTISGQSPLTRTISRDRARNDVNARTTPDHPAGSDPHRQRHRSNSRLPLLSSNVNSVAGPVVHISRLACHCPSTGQTIVSSLSFAVTHNRAITLVNIGNSNGSALIHVLYTLATPATNDVRITNIPITSANGHNHGIHPGSTGHGRLTRLHQRINCIVRRPRRRLFTSAMTRSITCNPHGRKLNRARMTSHIHRSLRLLRVKRLTSHSPFSLSNKRRQLTTVTNILTYGPSILVVSRPATDLSTRTGGHVRRLLHALGSHNIAILVVARSQRRTRRVTSHMIHVPVTTPTSNNPIATAIARPTMSSGNPTRSIVRQLSPHIGVINFLTTVFAVFTIGAPARLSLNVTVALTIVTTTHLGPLQILRSVRPVLVLLILVNIIGLFIMHANAPIITLNPLDVASRNIAVTILCTYHFTLMVVLNTIFLAAAAPATVASTFTALVDPLGQLNVRTRRVTLIVDLTLQFVPALASRAHTVISTRSTHNNSVRANSLTRHVGTVDTVVIPVFTNALHRTSGLDLTLSTHYCRRNVHHAR